MYYISVHVNDNINIKIGMCYYRRVNLLFCPCLLKGCAYLLTPAMRDMAVWLYQFSVSF